MIEDITLGEASAPFNMAIDTLRRLGDILREIKRVSSIQTGEFQKIKVSLVKQFFFNAVPLLKEAIVFEHQPQILALSATEANITKRYSDRVIRKEPVWSAALEKRLDEILIKIQQELQKEKYFMPPKKDLSRAVSEF